MNTPRATTIDLRRYVRAGDTLAWGHAGAEPRGLIARLLEQRHQLGGPIRVFLTGVGMSGALRPEHADVIGFAGIGGIGTHRKLAEAGCLDILPCRYSDLPELIDSGRVQIDVALALATPPDSDGFVSLGPTVAVMQHVLRAARVAIVEINPNVPFVYGDALVPLDRFDAVVHSEHALVAAPAPDRSPSAETEQLCRRVADLVPDGSTIQLGFGSVGACLPAFLRAHKNLGIHSAILTDGLADLVEAGVATGTTKEIDRGVAVGGELLGTTRLYEFAHRNQRVALRSTGYLLSHEVLERVESLVSVNGALEVDLTGQVNAESRDGVHVGAIGGQIDFVRAGARAPSGASIIAMLSTTREHASRIVPALDHGVVTTPRSEVELIVTEYGTADLRGRTLRDRADALIAIAHPAHRSTLQAIEITT